MRSFVPRLVLALFLLHLGACSVDAPPVPPGGIAPADRSESRSSVSPAPPGAYSLSIAPRDPTRKTVLGIARATFDISKADLRWLLNGTPVTTDAPFQFSCAQAPRGGTVQAVAIVGGYEVRSNVVEIGNTPPELTNVALGPEVLKPGESLIISAEATDLDGDPVTVVYSWTMNGGPAGNAPRLAAHVKRGDRVTVSITPYDGQSYGLPLMLNREINNMPPSFIEHKSYSFDGKRYVYRARAADPDGDTVAYALLSPPTDMSIDRFNGELVWTVPPDFKGQQPVTIRADDGHGGTAEYTVVFSLTEQPQTGQ